MSNRHGGERVPDHHGAAEVASSPCALDDVDPAWRGLADAAEIRALLAELLAAERAGARGITELCLPAGPATARGVLVALARDEGRCCSMLVAQLRRYGSDAAGPPGAFLERLAAAPDFPARLALLDRGQAWVVRRIDAALPRLADAALIADLRWMRTLHVENIARARRVAEAVVPAGEAPGSA
ncbi:MAG: DUF6306 domain-containing protein [Gammaproteobacteria bacterium]